MLSLILLASAICKIVWAKEYCFFPRFLKKKKTASEGGLLFWIGRKLFLYHKFFGSYHFSLIGKEFYEINSFAFIRQCYFDGIVIGFN